MNLSRRHLPSLMELVAFERAASHGSFTRAAEELSLTQGAVSRQIRSLEETLGISLFVRVRRSVVLTDAGRLYLNDVGRILRDLQAATERASAFGAKDVISLAVLPTFATRWLMPRIPGFVAGHPGVTIHFMVRLEPFSFDEEPCDAAIHFGDGAWPGARTFRLCNEQIVAVGSPALLERERLRRPADVLRATLLHQITRPDAWSDWLHRQGVEAQGALRGPRLEQFGMIAEAAIAGLGIALVPRFLVEPELADGRLALIEAPPVESRSAYWFVVPERKLDDPLIRAFGAWIAGETAYARRRSEDLARGAGLAPAS